MEKRVYRYERCNIDFYPHFISENGSARLFKYLEDNVLWNRSIAPGRRVQQNYGDPGISYTVTFRDNTIVRVCKPWLPILEKVRDAVTAVTGQPYNYCVVQRYPNGKVGINPHRDKEMDPNTAIAGISLGATRRLIMSPPCYNRVDKTSIIMPLNSGSLYVLNPPTNNYWTHCIEKDGDIEDVRISLTFRYYTGHAT